MTSATKPLPGSPTTTTAAPMGEAEFVRLRAKVDGGTPLDLATEAAALISEMQQATAATKPAAATLVAAAEAEAARLGRTLTHFEMEVLWEADTTLRTVKRVYDRQRARWRRANGIVRESNVLLRGGETVPLERRAPYRIEPVRPPAALRRWGPWRRPVN